MARFTGLIGICLILAIAYLFSNNRRKINPRIVLSGITIQIIIAFLVLKVAVVQSLFQKIGFGIQKLQDFAKEGAAFVYGDIAVFNFQGNVTNYSVGPVFVFAFNVTAVIILVCILVAVFYHLKVIQFIVSIIAKMMNAIMGVSGSEALSNIASVFVGQVEAQILIREYLPTMTKSELLASMSGSLACIAGGILVVYVNMGAHADYLISASLMAAPGALVISKIVMPETEYSPTLKTVKLNVKSNYTNILDAITNGAADGFKISMNVIAMLIGFTALIAMINWLLGMAHTGLSLDSIFSKIFYPLAWSIGVPHVDLNNSAILLGQKLSINEFVAFRHMTGNTVPIVTPKGLIITTVAICGFANFSSVGMQIGAIGNLVPERRAELARLGMKALLCGSLASYMSAAIAGIIM
jgi:CNT family concentrative nucleoside transporter